jgi:flagellar motor switch protein FliM
MVAIEVASVEQLTYQEFVQSLSNPSVISVLTVPPLKGNILFEVNTEIAFAYIDRVLGGTGENSVKVRVLTDIEEAVVRRFIETAVGHLKDAWANVTEFYPSIETMESNPQFAQIVPPNDMVVIITVQLKLGEVEGMMNICIPYLVLEPIMGKLTTTFWVASNTAKDSPQQIEILQKKLERTQVPFVVEMGSVNISINEFLTLGFGDVLQLETQVNDDLKCRIGTRTKFFCRPGTSGKKMAVQITGVVNEGDEIANE